MCEDINARISDYLAKHHPELPGYTLRSMANGYDLATGVESVVETAMTAFRNNGDVIPDDLAGEIERVRPPAGFIYVTVQKNNDRVGINIPIFDL